MLRFPLSIVSRQISYIKVTKADFVLLVSARLCETSSPRFRQESVHYMYYYMQSDLRNVVI